MDIEISATASFLETDRSPSKTELISQSQKVSRLFGIYSKALADS
jgi:hypothetical protein